MVEDLSLPSCEGLPEEVDPGNGVGSAASDGVLEKEGGLSQVVGEVEVPDGILSQPDTQQLVVRVTEVQAEEVTSTLALVSVLDRLVDTDDFTVQIGPEPNNLGWPTGPAGKHN